MAEVVDDSDEDEQSVEDAVDGEEAPDTTAWNERTDDWKMRVQAPVVSQPTQVVQIIDVQVLDSLPCTFHGGDPRHGDDFVLELATQQSNDTLRATSCTVLIFGVTQQGSSCLTRVTNFRPYVFYEANANDRTFRHRVATAARVDDDAIEFKQVYRRNTYGWVPATDSYPTTRKQFAYTQVFFPTLASMRRVLRSNLNYAVHEDRVMVDTKFMDDNELVPSGWMQVHGRAQVEQRISHCQIELECRMEDLKPLDRPEIAPLLVAYVDIETVSDTMQFPDAEKPKDEILQIGVNFWRVGWPKESTVKVLFVTPERCGPVDGAHVLRYKNETAMLRGFRSECMVRADPDVIATYNGFGFDLPYMHKRAQLLGIEDFFYMDRLIARKCTASTKELSSSALGQNDLFIIDMYGRTNLDLFHWIKAREKLDSYKLDSVANHFVGAQKDDMPYKKLFRWARGTPAQIATVGAYCLQDCYLLVLLTIRLQIFAANVEMSRQTHTPMELLVTRGQQIKVVNQLVWYGHRMERDETTGQGGYILNTPRKFSGGPDDKYMGATVIDAKAKYYRDPIATLDFMSLYPSIILANNFCFSTLVMETRYEDIDGVDYAVIEFDGKRYVWAKNLPGVIPIMMRNPLGARKAAKKMMAIAAKRIEECKARIASISAQETSQSALETRIELERELERAINEKAVYNARQQALKISANSIYGFTGALKTGMYPCLAVADSVTYRAREMLHHTVELVHEFTEESDVVYGDTDSVMIKFKDGTDVEKAAAIARMVAGKITRRFEEETGTKDIILEFEKVYWPWLLMSKKRYAGLMWEEDSEGVMVQTKLDAKGIQLVRRDNCALAKRVSKKVLDALMYKRDPELACTELRDELDLIVKNVVALDDYKISKSRRKTYTNEDQPHLAVCEKMRQRQPGSEPQVGDRVPYVLLIVPNRPKAKTFEKAEDIGYVRDHPKECRLDRLYYVEHQIENSVVALLEHVVQAPSSLFEACKRELLNQQARQRTLFDMLGPRQSSETPGSRLAETCPPIDLPPPSAAELELPETHKEPPAAESSSAQPPEPPHPPQPPDPPSAARGGSVLEDMMFSMQSRTSNSKRRKCTKPTLPKGGR